MTGWRQTVCRTLLVLALLCTGALLGAQELPHAPLTPRPSVNDRNPPPPPQPESQMPAAPPIVRNVDLVNLVVNVQGKHGGFISGLTRENFAVFEDGRPQRVSFFSSEDQVPLTMGLLIDTSPSQHRLLPEEQELSRGFFRQVLTAKDLAFILGFDVDLQVLQDLTSSQRLLDAGLNQAHIGGGGGAGPILNPGPFPTARHSGATHLWDAIVRACHDPLASQTGRKAIVVVTDGQDEGSQNSDKDALEAALDSNTVIFALVAADPAVYGGFYGGAGKLRKIAEQTGGASFDARPGKMGKAFREISDALRSQYTLAYRPDRPQKDGTFRKLEVKLLGPGTHDDKVHTRSGYYATRP